MEKLVVATDPVMGLMLMLTFIGLIGTTVGAFAILLLLSVFEWVYENAVKGNLGPAFIVSGLIFFPLAVYVWATVYKISFFVVGGGS